LISVSLFDLKARFRPDPQSLCAGPRRGCQGWLFAGLSPSSIIARPHLDSPEHGGMMGSAGMTMSRGARCRSVEDIAPHACIRWTVEAHTHDAWMRIGQRSSEAADPFYCAA